MARILRVGDNTYKVKVDSSGTITLDTGENTGQVIVTGNLIVQGNTTTVNTTNLDIEDNIITLNKGETGAGVTDFPRRSGIEIDRGTLPNAQFLFDEDVEWIESNATSFQNNYGAFTTRLEDNSIGALRTRSIVTGDKDINLNLLGPSPTSLEEGPGISGTAVVTIFGVDDYDNRIQNLISLAPGQIVPSAEQLKRYNSAIPSVGWIGTRLETFFETNPPEFIRRQQTDSILRIFDTASGDPESKLSLTLDNVNIAEWRLTRFDLQELRFSSTKIESKPLGVDLILKSGGTGVVAIEDSLKLKLVTSEPSSSLNSVVLYNGQEKYGGTGVYFVNSESTRDELVSRRKALAYSMIF